MDTNDNPGVVKGTILIVDDTPHNLRLLSNMLIEQGYMVRAVVNGKMALKSVTMDIPDIILLDVNMPGLNGYEVCRQLKQDSTTSHIPVIFISALDEVINKVEAFQAGGVDYITKPFHVEEVLARIDSQLMLQRTREDLRKLHRAMEQSPVSIVIMDKQGNIEYVNPRFTTMTGYTLNDVRGQPVWLFVGHEESSERYEHVLEQVRTGAEWQGQFSSRRGETIFWESVSLSPVFNEQGVITHVLEVREDVTERKRAEEALQEANEQLIGWVSEMEQYNREITLLNGMNDSLQLCQTVEDAYRTFEKSALQLFANQSGVLYIFHDDGVTLEPVVSWGDRPVVEHMEPDLYQAIQQKGVSKAADKETASTWTILDAESTIPYLCIPLASQGEVLGVLCLVGLPMQSQEIYEHWFGLALMLVDHFAVQLANLRLREQLREQSIRDPLTGLFNRRYLNETLRREIERARRYAYVVGIIMLDIDHFKRYNDTYGHEGGDVVLQHMGQFLQNSIRGEDIACRYGGEEFTLILPGASLEDTHRRAVTLCTEVRAIEIIYQERSLGHITVSLGVASFPLHGHSPEEVLEAADLALYQAKREGRNQVIVASNRAAG